MHVGITTPRAVPEFLVSITVLILGSLLYGAFLGLIAGHLEESYAMRRAYRKKINQVLQLISGHKVPRGLASKLLFYYQLKHREQQVVPEEEILAEISPALRHELRRHQFLPVKEAFKFESYSDTTLYDFVIDVLQREFHMLGDILIEGNQRNAKGLYVVVRGGYVLSSGGSADKYFHSIEVGQSSQHKVGIVGEMSLLYDREAVATVKADPYCESFRLACDDFLRMCKRFPAFRQHLQSVADKRAKDLETWNRRNNLDAARAEAAARRAAVKRTATAKDKLARNVLRAQSLFRSMSAGQSG